MEHNRLLPFGISYHSTFTHYFHNSQILHSCRIIVGADMIYQLLMTLGVLWFMDLIQTLTFTRKYGTQAEKNPFARFLLKHKNQDFLWFKVVDFIIITAILLFIKTDYLNLAQSLLISFNVLYAFTIAHNYFTINKQKAQFKD